MTTTTDLRDALRPSTKAGWALLGREALNSRSFTLINATDILAIEEEAASIVRDERSAEVAALVEALSPEALFEALRSAVKGKWGQTDHEIAASMSASLRHRAALAQTPPTDIRTSIDDPGPSELHAGCSEANCDHPGADHPSQTPPTDAGRVERCTFEHAWGDCGGERGFWRHDRATAKAAGDLYHPFRPAPITEDALTAALRKVLTDHGIVPNQNGFHSWRCENPDRYPDYCHCVPDLLDALIAAVEARAALTPERLAKALVATTIFAGHAHDCPVWMNRMIELRGERVDLDTCTCWVKDEAPDRARRILAALRAALRGDPIEATKPGPAASGSEGGTDHG